MGELKTALVTVHYDDENMKLVLDALAPAEIIHVNKRDSDRIAEALQRADIAILDGDLDDRYLAAPRLRWVHCDHAGLNKSARKEVFDKGVLLTGSAGRSGPALAEHCMFFMLALAYNFPAAYQAQQAHQWGYAGQGLKALYGRTLGILGMGHTGKELAVRAKAFNMNVLGYRRSVTEAPEGVDRLFCKNRGDSLDELLKECDFVALALPLSDATHHLLGEREFKLMKNTACVINMSRGDVIDEEAMIRALKEGQIGGAGLDVASQEPLPADHPLWDAPNVLITPHFTPPVPDKTRRAVNVICENIRRFRQDGDLINRVTEEDVYSR